MKQAWFCAAALVVSSFVGAASLHADFNEDYKTARELYNQREYEKARDVLEKLRASAQNDTQKQTALYYSTLNALRLQDYDSAMEYAKAMPDKPVSYNNQARILITQRKREEALALYKDLDLSTWPAKHAGDAYSYMATANRILGNVDEALANLDEALKIDDRESAVANYHIQQGDLYHRYKKENDKAIESYRKAYAASDEPGRQANAATRIAFLLIDQDKPQEALDELDKPAFEQLTSGYYPGQIALAKGRALAKLGKKDEAKAAFEKGLATKGIYNSQKINFERELEALK